MATKTKNTKDTTEVKVWGVAFKDILGGFLKIKPEKDAVHKDNKKKDNKKKN